MKYMKTYCIILRGRSESLADLRTHPPCRDDHWSSAVCPYDFADNKKTAALHCGFLLINKELRKQLKSVNDSLFCFLIKEVDSVGIESNFDSVA